jgi:RNA recognition motif-containing protein
MNLIVKNVDGSCSEQEITDFFSQFGKVNNVKMISEANMAFVSFTDRESARAAKQAASEILFKGRHLFVAFVEPKETRRLHFEEKIDKKAYEKH